MTQSWAEEGETAMRGKGRKKRNSQSLEILGLVGQKITTRKKMAPKPDEELGRVSSTGTISQREPAALPMDHMHVHTATCAESFCGPLAGF